MKLWKKMLIVSGVIIGVSGICVGILAGMTHAEHLVVRYPDGVREYDIRRPYGEHLMACMRYGRSYVGEYQKRMSEGADSETALIGISNDFGAVISDMKSYERPKVESRVFFDNTSEQLFRYELGTAGVTLVPGCYESLMWALDEDTAAEELYRIDEILSLDALKRRTTKLAEFTTKYATSGASRRKNISVATGYLNGTVIEPDGILSFNDIVGERTPERGFEEAKIIVNGEYVKGYGGGVCQVSTTLYNAWVLAGLGVEYATSHSLPSHYVALSRDAMVSSHNDMLLVNNTKTPIYVRAYCGNDDVTFEIYGMGNGMQYEIESEMIREVPPEVKVYGNVNEGEEYEELILSPGVPGFESRAYLVTYDESHQEVSRKILREDRYRSEPRIIERIPKSR